MKTNSLINTSNQYGWVSILLHWSMAIALIGMYLLGDYMVGLDYYDSWYHTAPALHKAVGVIIGLLIIFRIAWNAFQSKPEQLGDHSKLLSVLAKLGHLSLYLLMILLVISGYLISTAKGVGIDVFGLFEIPAFLAENTDRAEFAGKVHRLMGSVFILTVIVHAIAALSHQFILKDRTLSRMLWVKK